VTDPNYVGSASGTLIIDRTTIMSTATAVPNPAVVLQVVAFAVSAVNSNQDALTYTWDFGDGAHGSGATVMHAYALPGDYHAVVTADNGLAAVSSSVDVNVAAAAAVVGVGLDSDGDGFSDAFEIAVGTDPSNAASTPTGQPITAATLQVLTISKASIKLNFAKTGGDLISFSGTLSVPVGFIPNGAKLYFDASGVAQALTLTTKGSVTNGSDTVKIPIKAKNGVVAAQISKYSVTFKNGTFAATLAAAGLTNANAKGLPVTVTFTFIFNNIVYQKTQTMSYTAKKGKSGSAK
jgi:hypothetical protein